MAILSQILPGDLEQLLLNYEEIKSDFEVGKEGLNYEEIKSGFDLEKFGLNNEEIKRYGVDAASVSLNFEEIKEELNRFVFLKLREYAYPDREAELLTQLVFSYGATHFKLETASAITRRRM